MQLENLLSDPDDPPSTKKLVWPLFLYFFFTISQVITSFSLWVNLSLYILNMLELFINKQGLPIRSSLIASIFAEI